MIPLIPSRSKDKLLAGETLATVLSCTYDAGAGQALAFGIPLTKHFLITFNYWASGELHTGQFHSETAMPQGHLFPVTYDPAEPHKNSHSSADANPRFLWLLLVLALGVPLLAWLATSLARR